MPKKIAILIAVAACVLGLAYVGFRSYTKSFSPFTEVKAEQGALQVKVEYCRPSKKDREVFGHLVPYGQVWRTGANEATEIELSQTVRIGDKTLPAGRYTLFTIPNQNTWTIIFNKVLDQWGHFNYDTNQDALRIEVPAEQLVTPIETFTIGLLPSGSGIELSLAWDKVTVKAMLIPAE
jgi:hypothetical protein